MGPPDEDEPDLYEDEGDISRNVDNSLQMDIQSEMDSLMQNVAADNQSPEHRQDLRACQPCKTGSSVLASHHLGRLKDGLPYEELANFPAHTYRRNHAWHNHNSCY